MPTVMKMLIGVMTEAVAALMVALVLFVPGNEPGEYTEQVNGYIIPNARPKCVAIPVERIHR